MTFMEQVDEVLRSRLYSYSSSNRKNTNTNSIAIEGLTPQEEDRILDSYPQLVSEAYRGWMVKRLRAVGKAAFIQKAERAIKYGRDPQKLFVSLLK